MGRPKIIDQKIYAEILGLIVEASPNTITTSEICGKLKKPISPENLKNKLATLRKHPWGLAMLKEETGKGRKASKYQLSHPFSSGTQGKYYKAIPQELYPQLTLRLIFDSYQLTSYTLNPETYDQAWKLFKKSGNLYKKHFEQGEQRVLPLLTRIAAETILAKSSS